MQIKFQFDLTKAMQLIAYLVACLEGVDKIVLAKYLYLADRDYFLKYGHPITGDRQVAMKWGPLPSTCLKILRGERYAKTAFKYLHINDNRVTLHTPVEAELSESEKAVVDAVLAQHQGKSPHGLVKEMHQLPEYREAYVAGTSRPIPYELILKHYAQNDESKWRKGRPVISAETASQMNCPFGFSEPNL